MDISKKNPARRMISTPSENTAITTKKKKISRYATITAMTILMVCIAISCIISFALYMYSLKGWSQTVGIRVFTVTLNGRMCDSSSDEDYLTTVTSSELNLAKGQEADLVLTVSVDGNANNRFCVPYQIDFEITEGNLARAIEVYRYTENNEYEFVCMLDKFCNTTSDGSLVVGKGRIGSVNSPYPVTVGINGNRTHKYKLVYSQGAGDSFENESFVLKVTARHASQIYTNSEFYIYDIADFNAAIKAVSETDDPITLVLQNDITLVDPDPNSDDNTYRFTKKIGLNFNGHSINLNGNNIEISDSSQAAPNTDKGELCIIAPSTIAEYSPLTGITGSFIINLPNDVVRIADNLSDNTRIILHENGFSLAALNEHLGVAFETFCKTPVSVTASAYTFDFTDYFKYYLESGRATLALSDTDVVSSITNGIATVSEDYRAPAMTYTQYVQFSLSNGQTANYFSGNLTILGSNAYSVASRLADTVPEVITSSLFFPVYDYATDSAITWIPLNKKIINEKGDFLPGGYAALDSYLNQSTDIGIIVETAAGEKYTAVITRTAEILSLDERTNIIYSYPDIVLNGENSTFNIYTGVVDAALWSKFGFNRVSISFDHAANASNINYTGLNSPQLYVDLNDREGNAQTLQCYQRPDSIGALIVPATLTFEYKLNQDSAETGSFTLSRQIIVIGTNAVDTRDDATATLQPDFASNAYTNNEAYSFLVDGTYDDGRVLVEYSIPPAAREEWEDVIEIVNGVYTESAAGMYIRNTATGEFVQYADFVPGTTAITDYDNNGGTDLIRYDRHALVIVKPEFADRFTKTAPISAKLVSSKPGSSVEYYNNIYLAPLGVTGNTYIDSDWAEKTYVQEDGADIVYDLTLVVEGVYHNRDDEIADANMYNKLLAYYDYNLDGYISVNEALLEPMAPSAVSGYSVLDFPGLGITTIKGIEYFTNVTGLNFDTVTAERSNSVIDLSNLASLYALEYISFKNNKVADISSLAYLDALEYIDFGNPLSGTNVNNITDVSPLRYLPTVSHLDLCSNTRLADIEALSEYTELNYLNINDTSLGGPFDQYYITLIYNKNSPNFTQKDYGISYLNAKYSPSGDLQKAVNALDNLVLIDETFNTLHIPTVGNVPFAAVDGDTTYYLRWTSNQTALLDFLDGNGTSTSAADNQKAAASWSITSPVVDTNVTITIKITADANAQTVDATYFAVERQFTINLMQLTGHSNMIYIEDKAGQIFVASSLVTDSTLLGLLFEDFNTIDSETDVPIYSYVENGVTKYTTISANNTFAFNIKESNIVTQDDISTSLKTLTYSDKGITNLSGIEEFSSGIGSLDLKFNPITDADISPLSELTNMTTLLLAGQQYDFSKLSKFSESSFDGAQYTGASQYGSGLTNLEYLSVFGCYGLDDQTVLTSLYQVYLMNKEVDIFITAEYNAVGTTDDDIWDPYALPMAKYLNTLPSVFNYVTLTTGINDWHTTCLYKDENGALRVYAYLVGGDYHYTFRFYDVRDIDFTIEYKAKYAAGSSTLSSALETVDKSGTVKTSGTGVTGFKYKTLVGFTDTSYTVITLKGNDNVSFEENTIGRSGPVTGDHYTEHIADFNHNIKIKLNDEIYNGTYSLNELFPGRSLLTEIMKSYSGTNGFSIGSSGFLAKDPNLSVDGSEVFVLGTNKIRISDNALKSTGLFLTGGQSAIQNLQYTTVTKLHIAREAILGDGTWLMNLTELTIGYSAIDLSTLTKTLPNLTTFKIGKEFNVGKDTDRITSCWDVNMYDSGEYNIDDTTSEIYRCIVGLNTASERYSSIIGGTMLPESGDYLGASLQKEAFFNSDTAGAEAAALYAKLRAIARSKDVNGHYYFYLNYLPNVSDFMIMYTSVADWTGLLAYMFRNDTNPAVGNTDYFNGYYDKNSLESIQIYRSTDKSDFYTLNSNGGIAEPIIRKLYYASPDYVFDRNVTVNEIQMKKLTTTPSFKIGTMTDNKASDDYHPESFVDSSDNVVQGWHNMQFTHWEDAAGGRYQYTNYFTLNTAPTANVRKSRTEAAEAAEFLSRINDFGVKLNDLENTGTDLASSVYHYSSISQIVRSGGKVYLPTTTQKAMFGTDVPAVFPRNFEISWTKVSTTDSSPAIPTTDTAGYYEYSYSPTNDHYMIFKGEATVGATTKIIYYPVLFKGSGAYSATTFGTYSAAYAYSGSSVSYRQISDLQFRFLLYVNKFNAPQLDPTASWTDGLLSFANRTYAQYVSGIVSLDGIGIFHNDITQINNDDGALRYLNDASDLKYLTGLTSVRLENSMLSDVSWAKNLSSLTTLNLAGNIITDTYDANGTYFPTSLTTLNLNNNAPICAADLDALTTSGRNLSALQNLCFMNTIASHEEAMLSALAELIALKSANATLNVRITADADLVLNNERITAAKNFIAGTAYGASGLAQNGATGTNSFGDYASLIGSGYAFDTAQLFTSSAFGSGVTVTILNANIYSDGFATLPGDNTSARTVWFADSFTVSVKLGSYTFKQSGGNTETFDFGNQIAIYKTARTSDTGSRSEAQLEFTTSGGGSVTLSHSDIGSEIYSFIVKNWPCTLDITGTLAKLVFPYAADRVITLTGNNLVGLTTLKGIEKIPGLTYVRLSGQSGNTIISLSEFGFTSDNTSLTKLELNEYINISAHGVASVSHLDGLQELNLSKCSGIDYSTVVSGTSTLADIISGIDSITTLCINGAGNFYTGDTGIASDKRAFEYAANGTFGESNISTDYTAFDMSVGYKGPDTAYDIYARSRLSSVFNNALWWNGDTLAVKYPLNAFGIGSVSDRTDAWGTLIGEISDLSTLASRPVVPTKICNADITGIDPNYPNRTADITYTLPNSFYMFGESYPITWTIATTATDATALNGVFTDSAAGYHTFTMSETAIAKFENGNTITLTGACNGFTVTHTITVIIDQKPEYYTPASSNGFITAFYIEMENGEIVPANSFFDSYRLLYWIFNYKAINSAGKGLRSSINPEVLVRPQTLAAGGKVAFLTDTYNGKYITLTGADLYLSYEQVLSVTTIDIGLISKEDSGIGVSSLKGLELFKNCTSLTIRQGYTTSLNAIRDMRLETFVYNNSNIGNSNTLIQDWTPLYNSRDTLVNFTYMRVPGSTDYYIYAEDYSFLMGFSALKNVSIGSTSDEGPTDAINKTPAFKYMLAWFLINNRNVTFTYGNTVLFTGGVLTSAAEVDSELLAAARILSAITYLDNTDFNIVSNYELFPRTGKTTAQSLILPSYINQGGALHPIEWVSVSSFGKVEYLTAANAAISVTDENDYFTSAATANKWKLTVSNRDAIYLSNIHLIARIMYNGVIYERMLTLNCADNNIYPSITLSGGYASYNLGSGSFDVCSGYESFYTITDTDGGKTLALNSTAVGNDIYVNVDGVRTKVYFTVDAAYFTAASNYRTAITDEDPNYYSTLARLAELKAHLDDYDSIGVGMWQYITDAFPADGLSQKIQQLNEKLNFLSIPVITVTYSGAGTDYTTTNPQTWHPSSADVTLDEPTRAGFHFVGWYTDSDCAQADIISQLTSTSLQAYIGFDSFTLYPKFIPSTPNISYVLVLEINGHTVSSTNDPSNRTYLESASDNIILAPTTNFTMPCVFGGWYLDAERTRPISTVNAYTYAPNQTSLTLYASYVDNSAMTLEYGGSGFTHSNTATHLGPGKLVLSDAVNNDNAQHFIGWNTAADGTGDWVAEIPYEAGGSVTLYPRFTDKTVNTYLALTTYFRVGKLANKVDWEEYTFYYKLTNDSVGKIQLNTDRSFSIVKFASDVLNTDWAYSGAGIGTPLCTLVPDRNTYSLGSYKVTYNHTAATAGTAASFVTVAQETEAKVYTINGNGGMGNTLANNTPNPDYMFVYLYTAADEKDIYALWIEKNTNVSGNTTYGSAFGLEAYNANTGFQARIVESTFDSNDADSNPDVTSVYSQNSTEQYKELAPVPNTASDAINIGRFGSYNNAKNGEFLIFCPQGNCPKSPTFNVTGSNPYMNYGNLPNNSITADGLYSVVGTPTTTP